MELSKKERRKLKREERRKEELSRGRKKSVKFWAVSVLIVLAVFAIVYFGYLSFFRAASAPEIGEVFPIEGENHVAEGTKVDYHTNPPTSGPHYGVPANWGIYDHEIPDEAVMHNLEHGGIWITYKSDVQEAAKKRLEEITRGSNKVIMTPRSKNDSAVALVSWGRIYRPVLSAGGDFDEEVVKNFILKYRNTGPEKLVPESAPGKDY